jgi:drug/metabolite transporter (DMT)-like permease
LNRYAALLALFSAALFGVSTPAAKVLLESIDPTILAGLLYSGAGAGIGILRCAAPRRVFYSEAPEVSLSRREIPWLAGAIATGGILGPMLLMFGLARTDASSAALYLTLEGVATALMAWFMFRENFDGRIALGLACLVAGAIVLAWTGEPTVSGLLGPLAIVAACVAWGLDNNLTRKVSLADPLQIVAVKGAISGPANLGYGVSLALFVLALRGLGTARTGAYFSTAPFIGALAAVALLHEPLTLQLMAAGALMGVGVWLHLTEHHEHEHTHEPMEHAHPHVHDEHHQHEHSPDDPQSEPHTHWHRHEPLTHKHPHVPDAHHRHAH